MGPPVKGPVLAPLAVNSLTTAYTYKKMNHYSPKENRDDGIQTADLQVLGQSYTTQP